MRIPLLATTALLVASSVAAQPKQDFTKVQIKTTKVAEGVFMLEGAGGNMALSVGKDGAVLVDDQFAPLSPKILAAARKAGAPKVKFVINTHWHGDHTGGNENLGKTGSVVVAHANVRKRMSTEQFIEMMNLKVPPSAAGALPVVTFTSDVSFHLGGEVIRVQHIGPAHTDGDSLVFFEKANVIHMGDTMMTISYPFVDTGSGGRYSGYITAADAALAMANDKTVIIPGHGPATNKAGLQAWRDMLAAIRASVAKLAGEGKTLEQIIAAKPTAQWDAQWGQAFIKPEVLLKAVFADVRAK
jgi:glyoxylase-like metal-dependent hydrolase (beta-lactamase superfamily II)